MGSKNNNLTQEKLTESFFTNDGALHFKLTLEDRLVSMENYLEKNFQNKFETSIQYVYDITEQLKKHITLTGEVSAEIKIILLIARIKAVHYNLYRSALQSLSETTQSSVKIKELTNNTSYSLYYKNILSQMLSFRLKYDEQEYTNDSCFKAQIDSFADFLNVAAFTLKEIQSIGDMRINDLKQIINTIDFACRLQEINTRIISILNRIFITKDRK